MGLAFQTDREHSSPPFPRAALHVERGPAGLHSRQCPVTRASHLPGWPDRQSLHHILCG